jgi:hypothetical protein
MLVINEHFEWAPPHRGRMVRGGDFKGHGDPSAAVKFTAMVPLLIALHEPWENFLGGVTIGHMRLARETEDSFDLVRNLSEDNFLVDPPKEIKMALRENNRPKHQVAGGPQWAIAYHDENVIPAFWYKEGTEATPYTYIVHKDEMGALELAFRQQGRVIRAAAEDPYAAENGKMGVAPTGPIRRKTIIANIRGKETEVQLGYDSVGIVFSIAYGGNFNRGSVMLYPGVTVALSGMILDRRLRAALGLASLQTGEVEAVHDGRVVAPVNSLATAFAHAEPVVSAAPKAVPVAVRRATAPKLSDVVVHAEVEEFTAAEVESLREQIEDETYEAMNAKQSEEFHVAQAEILEDLVKEAALQTERSLKVRTYSDYHKDFYGFRPASLAGISEEEIVRQYDAISEEIQKLKTTREGRDALRANAWIVEEPEARAKTQEYVARHTKFFGEAPSPEDLEYLDEKQIDLKNSAISAKISFLEKTREGRDKLRTKGFEVEEPANEPIPDVDPQALDEVELNCVANLGLLLDKQFHVDVRTVDGRLIIPAGKVVETQDLVNLVVHKGNWEGDDEELMLARIAVEEVEAHFVQHEAVPA